MLQRKNLIVVVIILILLLGNVFFAWKYIAAQDKLVVQGAEMAKVNLNSRVLDFTSLFIQKVLRAKGEVSFEDRLQLETVVRNLSDVEILDQWNKFVNSKDEAQAQDEVKNLLGLLLAKIKS